MILVLDRFTGCDVEKRLTRFLFTRVMSKGFPP